ncbi:MAG TPA: hypothetical protein VFX21_17560 [Acidimicrobiia bacterium]|nr:hypothetical protein [Acidimicrobiia bacterium]
MAERRAKIARIAAIGTRLGYLALAVSIVAFFVGLATDWPNWTVTLSIAGLVFACIVMPLPIVLGYGVRAAEREDRERGNA